MDLKVELVVIPDCANEAAAAALLRAALDDVGLTTVSFRTSVIANQDEAAQRGFPGSPTFLIGGHDAFGAPPTRAGLTCRLYQTADGLAGIPSLVDLRQALERAADLGVGQQ